MLTRAPLGGGGFFIPAPPVFLDICHTSGAINTKLAVPFKQSHHMCEKIFRTYHRLAANDVRVTSCPGDFDAKEGSTRIALLDSIFKFQPSARSTGSDPSHQLHRTRSIGLDPSCQLHRTRSIGLDPVARCDSAAVACPDLCGRTALRIEDRAAAAADRKSSAPYDTLLRQLCQ